MSEKEDMPKFIQISSGPQGVYALDKEGTVWKYVPATEKDSLGISRYAFWTSLTSHQVDSRTGARKK